MSSNFYVQQGPDGHILNKELNEMDREQQFRSEWGKWL